MRCCCIDGFCKASSTSRTLLRVRRNQDSNRISGIHRASVLFIEMLGDLQAPRRTLSRTPRITHVGTPDMSTTNKTSARVGCGRLVRPRTRGELRDRLKAGESCEVAAHVAEMTAIVLSGWLKFDRFNVDQSPNAGWVIFSPNAADDRRRAHDSAQPNGA